MMLSKGGDITSLPTGMPILVRSSSLVHVCRALGDVFLVLCRSGSCSGDEGEFGESLKPLEGLTQSLISVLLRLQYYCPGFRLSRLFVRGVRGFLQPLVLSGEYGWDYVRVIGPYIWVIVGVCVLRL